MPTDAAGLILFLVNLGITLTEQDQQKIHDAVIAAKADADRASADADVRDADALQKLGGI